MSHLVRKNKINYDLCTLCTAEKKSVNATVYCFNCNCNFCASCMDRHKVIRAFTDHLVVDMTQMQTATSAESRCKIHDGKEARYFCQTCKTGACTLCVFANHAEHDVTDLRATSKQQLNMAPDLEQDIRRKASQKRDVKAPLDDTYSTIQQASFRTKEDAPQVHATNGDLIESTRAVTELIGDDNGQFEIVYDNASANPHVDMKEKANCFTDCTTFTVVLGRTTIQTLQGDLTRLPVDAIVNAANERLDHGGGLAKAIVNEGGNEIQRECRKYVSKHGCVKTGQVYVSESGRLPCRKVIHAVGPKWKDGKANEEKKLHAAIYESLLAAQSFGFSSIALPALSGGIFGYPLDKCTMTIASAIKDFLEAHKQTCLTTVSLVDKGDAIVKMFGKSLGMMSGLQPVTTSEGTVKESITEGTKLPNSWSVMDKHLPLLLEKLDKSSHEYKHVKSYLTENTDMLRKQIHRIERVQNPSLWRQHILRDVETSTRCSGETFKPSRALYETAPDAVDDISTNGFKASAKNATVFDDGVCFTTFLPMASSSKKPGTKKTFIFQVRLVTGECTVNTDGRPVRHEIDTVVDNTDRPTKYVLRHSDQAYPEYLITLT